MYFLMAERLETGKLDDMSVEGDITFNDEIALLLLNTVST